MDKDIKKWHIVVLHFVLIICIIIIIVLVLENVRIEKESLSLSSSLSSISTSTIEDNLVLDISPATTTMVQTEKIESIRFSDGFTEWTCFYLISDFGSDLTCIPYEYGILNPEVEIFLYNRGWKRPGELK